MKTQIVLVDDHASVREMLACVLGVERDLQITGHADCGVAALRMCETQRPDLMLLDLNMPQLNGVEVLRRVRLHFPKIRVLVYSGTSNQSLIIEALRARPNGFVSKTESLQTLRDGIHAVIAGGSYFSGFVSGLLFESGSIRRNPNSIALSPRENEVLQLIAEGRSTKEISAQLNVACKTIEHHREHLMAKLNIHEVASLTRYAISAGLISVE